MACMVTILEGVERGGGQGCIIEVLNIGIAMQHSGVWSESSLERACVAMKLI